MDNLAAHKVKGVREAIEARGACLLYVPPYSPDLNPSNKFLAGASPASGMWRSPPRLRFTNGR